MSTVLGRALSKIRRGIQLALSRAVVTLVDDGPKMQEIQLQILTGELVDGVEKFEPYGLTSHPFTKSEAIAASIGGARGHLVALVVGDRRYRLAGLAEGEVALFDDQGQYVKIARSGIHVHTTQDVVLHGGTTTIEGDLHVTGNISGDGDAAIQGDISDQSGVAQSMAAMRDKFNAHTHPVPGITSGPTTATATATGTPM